MTTAARESSHRLRGRFGRGIMEGSFGTGTPNRNGMIRRDGRVRSRHSKRPRPIPVTGSGLLGVL